MAFSWFRRQPKDLVIPEDSRIVETPILGSGEKILSDLFPVDAITSSFPVIGTTTYSGMAPLIKVRPDGSALTDFDSYVLRSLERVPNTRFVRCSFTRGITVDLDVPTRTVFYFDDEVEWDPILLKVRFIKDHVATFATEGPGGHRVYVPRYFPRIFYIDGQRGGTLVKEDHYVADSDLLIGQYETPMPTTVSYEFHNIKDSFGRCLHKKMIFDAQQGAFVAYDTASASAVAASSSISGQSFAATNFETWETYVKSFKLVQDGLLKEYVRKTVYPPDLPAISVA